MDADLLRIIVQTSADEPEPIRSDEPEPIRCQYPAMQLIGLVLLIHHAAEKEGDNPSFFAFTDIPFYTLPY